jgi:hypothetical protein
MLKKPALLPIALILAGGCSMGYKEDPGFNNWLKETQSRCDELYGPLPTMSAAERDEFLQLGFDTYYGGVRTIQFVEKLNLRYPNHLLAIDCLASAFPRLPR